MASHPADSSSGNNPWINERAFNYCPLSLRLFPIVFESRQEIPLNIRNAPGDDQ